MDKPTLTQLFPQEARLQIFSGYNDADLPIFEEFTDPDAWAEPEFIVDFIGMRTRTASVWGPARGLDGAKLPPPIPCDYHAETVEWLGLLRSVKSAEQNRRYRVLELGAGFGMWSVAGGVAARLKNIADIKIYAVEADPLLFGLMLTNFSDNGFYTSKHGPIYGAVGVTDGVARWPKFSGTAETATHNFRPIIGSEPDYMVRESQDTIEVPMLGFNDLLGREPRWDLVHFDIQGHEHDLCFSALENLNRRVRRMVIGTHSRKIESDLLSTMRGAGWLLENEKPCRFTFSPSGTFEAMTTLDGTQVWLNTRLD